jgi:hypothetical protein
MSLLAEAQRHSARNRSMQSPESMEKDRAVAVARVILKPGSSIDPQSDVAIVCRQLLRALALPV